MTPGVALRAATDADEPFLRGLLGQVRATEFALLPEQLAATLVGQQRKAQRLAIAARPSGLEEIALAAGGDRVARLATARDELGLRIVDITVDVAHRGRGLGTALVRTVLERAAAEGAPVSLRVAHGNRPARWLYEREGFVEVGGDQLDAFLRWDPPAT